MHECMCICIFLHYMAVETIHKVSTDKKVARFSSCSKSIARHTCLVFAHKFTVSTVIQSIWFLFLHFSFYFKLFSYFILFLFLCCVLFFLWSWEHCKFNQCELIVFLFFKQSLTLLLISGISELSFWLIVTVHMDFYVEIWFNITYRCCLSHLIINSSTANSQFGVSLWINLLQHTKLA